MNNTSTGQNCIPDRVTRSLLLFKVADAWWWFVATGMKTVSYLKPEYCTRSMPTLKPYTLYIYISSLDDLITAQPMCARSPRTVTLHTLPVNGAASRATLIGAVFRRGTSSVLPWANTLLHHRLTVEWWAVTSRGYSWSFFATSAWKYHSLGARTVCRFHFGSLTAFWLLVFTLVVSRSNREL